MSPTTVAHRVAQGRSARKAVPRSTQSEVGASSDRDPIALIEAQNASRVPELVPVRNGRMLASPLAYFRGSPVVMAHDLATLPSTGLYAQLSGDAHLSNFGGFASAEHGLVFDLNDFDETLPGPFEWDVKRLAASVEIAGRQRGLSRSQRKGAVGRALHAYRITVRQFATMSDLDVWYTRLDAWSLIAALRADRERKLERELEQTVAKARRNDGRRAVAKLTRRTDGRTRFVSEPPVLVPLDELADREEAEVFVRTAIHQYGRTLRHDRRLLFERYHTVDMARKVVGVGSVGTRCWVVLLLGEDERDPLLLQVKEAEASVLEPYLGRTGFASHGQRVVEGQLLLQASSDIFLGWIPTTTNVEGRPRDFYVRRLRDWKASVDVETISASALERYAEACGWTLARAHARSGERVAIASYLGGSDAFDRAVAEYAASYADLNERDHTAFAEAVAAGRLPAVEGV
jgi:uncharacterized protein (DUF2252 family)